MVYVLIMALADRIRASRRITIEVGAMRFHANRPTLEELSEIYSSNPGYPELARKFVDGWDHVRECDLLLEGAPDEVQFDAELFNAALGDLPQVWRAIGKQLIAEATAYYEKAETHRKNLPAG